MEKNIRLLWLIDSLTMGGAESLAVTIAREARRRAIDLTVCARTSIGGNPLEAEIRALGVDVVSLDARNLRDRAAYRRLVGLVRDFDVVHAHLTYAAIWGALASRKTRVPLVATLHVPPGLSSLATLRDDIRERILVFLLNRYASRVIVVSHALREAWGARLRNVVVVRNGVDVRAAPRRWQAVAGATALQIITIAVLREGKGIDTLIEAARYVPNANFVVVGDGPLREALEQQASGLPITFTGFRRDVAQLLAESDLFVHPTLADAFPTVLLEAMAAGLPVIASNVGGVPEIVDAHSGMLVPPGDARALANAINAAHAEWREVAGAAGRERVERELSVDRWLDQLERLYAEVR